MISHRTGLRTWIEIDTKAIEHNYKTLRALIPAQTKFMSVVKSNAYGHSLLDFGKYISDLGADFLGVDSIVEGIALRNTGVTKPVLVLGFTLPEMIEKAVEHDLSLTVSTLEFLNHVDALTPKKPLKIHIKVDTGMHRHGFTPEQKKDIVLKIKNLGDKIFIEGLFTHFAAAKNPAFPQDTRRQIEEFKLWIEALAKEGINPAIKHACASSGTLLYPEAHFDMVRIGICMYGLWPSREAGAFVQNKIFLKPVLTWKTVVGEVNKIGAGERVGYDFTETLHRDTLLADCPVGYWHGLPRALSGIGHVLINGKKAKIVGRVSMDIITVDVTDIPDVKVGSEVVIIGTSGSESITPEHIASLCEGSSSYEVITRLNPLIKRIFF